LPDAHHHSPCNESKLRDEPTAEADLNNLLIRLRLRDFR
jgi:hypothetical protein